MSVRERPHCAAALGVLSLLGLAPVRAGESLYVVEQVVVSLNSAADGSGERVASLKSGDRVELIERAGEAVHVRLADGKDGWLRAFYVSGDEPMRPRLAQSEADNARLKAQLAALQAQASASVHTAAPSAAAPPEDPAAAGGALFNAAPDPAPGRAWAWALAGALVGLGGGFALGWRTLDRSIRRKYGGLKIY